VQYICTAIGFVTKEFFFTVGKSKTCWNWTKF